MYYSTIIYLFQLFDKDNPLHETDNDYIFTTEGHLLPLNYPYREKLAKLYEKSKHSYMNSHMSGEVSVLELIACSG